MEMTYSRIIYSCLIFGSGILCDRKLERRQAVSSCSVNTEDNFYCSNDLCIKLSWVCDGRKDCPDGSDETKELCGQYEYGSDMTMDCGRVNIKKQAIFKEGKNQATIETAPWYVAIFKLHQKVSKPYYYYWCAGSIIAPNVVISEAHCFWEKGMSSNQISINDGLYKITVGKYDRNFTIIDHDFTQIIEAFYWEQEGYCPFMKNSTQSLVLLEKSMTYININDCRELYFNKTEMTYDKFCAGSKLGKRTCPYGNSGHGLSYLHSNSYFLTGVMSLKNKVNNFTVHGFTDIKYHVPWIREILIKQITVNSCVLPIVEGVIYSYEGSDDILSHGTIINRHLTVIEKCELGYHKAYPRSLRFCLGKGKWVSNYDKLCLKMCPPLESDSLDIECSYNGKYANCSNLSIPDTIATPSCKPTYILPNGQEDTPVELHCQPNGMWSNKLYRCKPYCGRTYIKSEALIGNGEKALVGTAPWNVGIYRLDRKNSNHEMICGGSVIASNLVVSAAHCFWNKDIQSNIILINDGLYKIAVGKYDRSFTIIDNEFTQIMNVEMIHVHKGYHGSVGFYADDISILVLRNRLSFSNGVAPICIDWNDKYNVVSGDKGKVVGWGKTEKDIPSPILLEAYLPYINHSSCRKIFTDGFERFVTIDKFCAGSSVASGQSVGQGDSGAGLCFFHYDSYYLIGVVSVKDPNSNNNIAVFTEIKPHIQWIRGLYTKYN